MSNIFVTKFGYSLTVVSEFFLREGIRRWQFRLEKEDFLYLNPIKSQFCSSRGMDSPCKPTGQASIPMNRAGGVDPTTHATLVAERYAGHGPTDALFGSLEDIPRGAVRQMEGSMDL